MAGYDTGTVRELSGGWGPPRIAFTVSSRAIPALGGIMIVVASNPSFTLACPSSGSPSAPMKGNLCHAAFRCGETSSSSIEGKNKKIRSSPRATDRLLAVLLTYHSAFSFAAFIFNLVCALCALLNSLGSMKRIRLQDGAAEFLTFYRRHDG